MTAQFINFSRNDVPAEPNTDHSDVLSGAAIRTAWTHAIDDKTASEYGIWDCTAGTFTANYAGISEFCHIIEGEAQIKDVTTGEVFTVKAGDSFVLKAGIMTEWTIPVYVRKCFAITEVKK